MPQQVELHLIPTPGAKPEFLSTVEGASNDQLPPKIVLEAYTRDAWATKPEKGLFSTVMVKSVDKRQKLPGFLKYLKERQKAAYGRFAPNGVWVISHVQPPSKDPASTSMMCRYSLTLDQVPSCPLNKHVKRPSAPPQPAVPRQSSASKPAAKSIPSGGGGLLGKLVGAQQRTNQHVLDSIPQPKTKPPLAAAAASEAPNGNGAGAATAMKTGQEVLAEFRQKMEQKLLDFDISSDVVLKVPLSLAESTKSLMEDEKSKVTMEILKYIVYEQAEEVNEDWVAAKEPSEFMDEAVIAVYKEGHAPQDVLEDLNKGDLPDEVRGQERAIQEAMRKQAAQKEAKAAEQLRKQAHRQADDEDLAQLNTVKRDRRTIEEIQRDMVGQDDPKRQRTG